ETLIRNNISFKNAEIVKYNPTELLFDVEEYFLKCNIIIIDTYFGEEYFDVIDLVKKINERYFNTEIIFISDNNNYVEKVYETNHCFYIQKENLEFYLENALKKSLKELGDNKKSEAIEISSNRIKQFVRIKDILYITKDGRKTIIVTKSGRINTINPLSYYEGKDKSGNLCRIHSSYIANIENISFIKSKTIVIIDGSTLPVSDTFSEHFKENYFKYWENRQ
nr:LytTR family transcriptional regulator DNA-binding domain-containing protein [Lachnospiraceae bacterium]